MIIIRRLKLKDVTADYSAFYRFVLYMLFRLNSKNKIPGKA